MPSFTLKIFQALDRKSCRYIIPFSHTLNKVRNSYKSQNHCVSNQADGNATTSRP